MIVPGGLICDPGPCDPGAITVVLRDFGLLPVMVFAAAGFVAGRKVSRRDLLLPALCMAAIAAAFYAGFSQKMRLVRIGLTTSNDRALTERFVEAAYWDILPDYAMGWLVFALIPLAVGFASGALYRGKAKLRSAQ